MKEALQRETIENQFFAHGAPLPGVRDEGRLSGRTCL
jgi:hypothetical protein